MKKDQETSRDQSPPIPGGSLDRATIGETRKAKRPKPARGKAFGILNPWGDVWTYDTFQTHKEAHDHLVAFWKKYAGFGPTDLTKFRIVGVRVTVSALPDGARPGASTTGLDAVPGTGNETVSGGEQANG